MATKLFDNQGKQIFPVTNATSVSTEAGSKQNVEICLKDLYDKITDLSQEGEAAKYINVKIGYLLLDSKDKAFAEEQTNWGAFDFPTAELPYLWKRTAYSYDKVALTTTYEIVLMYPENETQTVYKAYVDPDKEQPEIFYATDEEGKPDYQNPLLIEYGWQYDPVSISAERPYVYMAVRQRKDGQWEPFSTPALLGKWTFDSTVIFKYAVTKNSNAPALNTTLEDPGSDWKDTNPGEFVGYLWMINATKIDKNYYQNADKIIWNGPNLISIVK